MENHANTAIEYILQDLAWETQAMARAIVAVLEPAGSGNGDAILLACMLEQRAQLHLDRCGELGGD